MKNSRREIARAIGSITQLGLTVVFSFLIWIGIASFVQNALGLGNSILVAGILLGAGSGALSFVKFIKSATKKEDTDE